MLNDIQRTSMWKRISAFLCDIIVLSIVVMGFSFLLSSILGYDSHNERLEKYYTSYESQYGINFEIGNAGAVPYTDEEEALFKSLEKQYEGNKEAFEYKKFDISWEKYEALSTEERILYDFQYSVAYKALTTNEDVLYTYNLVINMTLLITTASILIAYVITEFILPIIFRNGQTVGKKIFGIALIRTDGVRINNMMLFVRTVLGKFTIETMIPVYIIIMLMFNSIGVVGTIVLGLILLLQIILLATTKNRTPIHDILAGTVAVDASSQMIFDTEEDLIKYKNRLHEEAVAKAEYK